MGFITNLLKPNFQTELGNINNKMVFHKFSILNSYVLLKSVLIFVFRQISIMYATSILFIHINFGIDFDTILGTPRNDWKR